MSDINNRETIHTTVFAETPTGGNPCPIVPDADDLSFEDMLSMAAGFGMECLFLQKPDRPDCSVKFRYFTPGKELASCGHATLAGIAYLISVDFFGKDSAGEPITETNIDTASGAFHIHWTSEGEIYMAQFLPEFGPAADVETRIAIASALGIEPDDLGTMPIQSVSTSRPKLMVAIRTREIMDNLKPDFPALWSLCDATQTSGFYVFSFEDGEIYARQYPNNTGYLEDPATGVAASALGCYLAKYASEGTDNMGFSFHIYQGQAMGRPSMIGANVETEQGEVTKIEIFGKVLFLKEKAASL